MYLKQIEIIGFKSFADKSKIVLVPGVTGVVGPNGSGKSNIADAVRWVLGEQSVRNLRGSKMEDVIFAGSDGRRPTNLCEVSLVLDNEDGHLPVVFDEVTVTRRVFRSGESEYMINRQPCRLRDIHELFMDSGLGREAYSIIGQGKIEEMLSTRAEDRRGPFEDAAGIVKFKHRRKEAEKRLDETNSNLMRVEDILAELEEQVAPLAKEKERAERYKELASALEIADITLLVVEIDKLNARFQAAAEGAGTRQTVRDEAAMNMALSEQSWQKDRDALNLLSQQLEHIQQTYVQFVEARQKAQGELALAEQELGHLAETEAARDKQYRDNAEELERIEEQCKETRVALQQMESHLEVKSGELEAAAELSKEQRRERLVAELDELNSNYIEANHQAATLRNELKMLDEQASTEVGKRTKYEQDAAQLSAQIDALDAERGQCETELSALLPKLERFASEIAKADKTYEAAMAEESDAVLKIHRVVADSQSLSSRLELLRDLEDGYDGYALGVRTVMQQAKRSRLTGVFGTVAELIRVEKRIETAIETALGAALQNVVVEREEHARSAIQMLKQRQAGRATFMPLDVIQSRRLRDNDTEKVADKYGFIGVASDLVEIDSRFRPAIENLLGNVVIADSLAHAGELAKVLGYRVRIVTLEGDVVSPGGLMSGGHHQRKGPGLLGRSRERTDMERRLAELVEAKSMLEAQQAAARARATVAQESRKAEQQNLETAVSRRQAVEAKQKEIVYTRKSLEERQSALEWEFHQLVTGTDVFTARREHTANTLVETERRLVELEETTAHKRRALSAFEEDLAKRQDAVTGLRIEVATMRQEHSSAKHRLQELTSRETRLRDTLRLWTEETRELTDRLAKLGAAKQSAEAKVIAAIQAVETSQGELEQVRASRLECEAQARQAEKVVAQHRTALADADELLHRAHVATERADADLNHALQKIGEAYGMTYEWAKAHYPLTTEPDELQRAATRLRRQVEALGEVNIGAIEEYDRLDERISFLSEQKSDLVTAQTELHELIDEIDTEMAARFMETFTKIRQEFAHEFEVLFGGGEASLQLTDPETPLSTGIEVVAKPPGKRLQNLNLLSGGERALTAMALLFAILKVRPVPFCVLDEVEAALDEANVSRFAQQLRSFAHETQFIVITHRRGTMEEVDALYGVTMPERGVSSLVSVRLADEVDFETA